MFNAVIYFILIITFPISYIVLVYKILNRNDASLTLSYFLLLIPERSSGKLRYIPYIKKTSRPIRTGKQIYISC
jgi:hypothetical protein